VEFVVSLLVLIITYTKNEFIQKIVAIGVPAIHRCGRVGFFESVVEIGTRKV